MGPEEVSPLRTLRNIPERIQYLYDLRSSREINVPGVPVVISIQWVRWVDPHPSSAGQTSTLPGSPGCPGTSRVRSDPVLRLGQSTRKGAEEWTCGDLHTPEKVQTNNNDN